MHDKNKLRSIVLKRILMMSSDTCVRWSNWTHGWLTAGIDWIKTLVCKLFGKENNVNVWVLFFGSISQ